MVGGWLASSVVMDFNLISVVVVFQDMISQRLIIQSSLHIPPVSTNARLIYSLLGHLVCGEMADTICRYGSWRQQGGVDG